MANGSQRRVIEFIEKYETYLAGVLATFGKSSTNEAGRDWLEI